MRICGSDSRRFATMAGCATTTIPFPGTCKHATNGDDTRNPVGDGQVCVVPFVSFCTSLTFSTPHLAPLPYHARGPNGARKRVRWDSISPYFLLCSL